uniref:Uncharacterized protein n=1 Tax=Opuntia streptacantha TaxID=393608 RepID=A0A7C9E4F4_OPUST
MSTNGNNKDSATLAYKCTQLNVRILRYNNDHIINTRVRTDLSTLHTFIERYWHSNLGSKLLSITLNKHLDRISIAYYSLYFNEFKISKIIPPIPSLQHLPKYHLEFHNQTTQWLL